jgi:hypothetical protein
VKVATQKSRTENRDLKKVQKDPVSLWKELYEEDKGKGNGKKDIGMLTANE